VTGFDTCSEQVPCCEPGTICNENTGECVFEVCVPKWHPCKADHECCKGLICDDKKGVCKEDDRCGVLGDHCDSSNVCCHGLACFEAICNIPKGCVDDGDPCHPDAPCCDALVCDGKHCTRKSTDPTKPPPAGGVSTLPNTGASRPDESNGWLGVIAAGGAVAAAATVLRRNRERPEEGEIS
jgi:hypothetical protein